MGFSIVKRCRECDDYGGLVGNREVGSKRASRRSPRSGLLARNIPILPVRRPMREAANRSGDKRCDFEGSGCGAQKWLSHWFSCVADSQSWLHRTGTGFLLAYRCPVFWNPPSIGLRVRPLHPNSLLKIMEAPSGRNADDRIETKADRNPGSHSFRTRNPWRTRARSSNQITRGNVAFDPFH
jgi:hypothetical protein